MYKMDAKSETRILRLERETCEYGRAPVPEKGETCGFRREKPGYQNFTYYCVYSAEVKGVPPSYRAIFSF